MWLASRRWRTEWRESRRLPMSLLARRSFILFYFGEQTASGRRHGEKEAFRRELKRRRRSVDRYFCARRR
jgi:hypothetical protein